MKEAGVTVTLLTAVWEVFGSNLGWETGYHN
jgi:hypothetical protein